MLSGHMVFVSCRKSGANSPKRLNDEATPGRGARYDRHFLENWIQFERQNTWFTKNTHFFRHFAVSKCRMFKNQNHKSCVHLGRRLGNNFSLGTLKNDFATLIYK
jgi:hypothetical protein